MLLGDIYSEVIRFGIEHDPRGVDQVKKELEKAKKRFEEAHGKEKTFFDTEKLTNPYSDTRLLYGNHEREVNTILAGVDIEVGEVLFADRLREKGEPIDLLFAHHPEGKAMAIFYEVMNLQADILNMLGISISVAEGMLEGRVKEVARKVMPVNHNRAVDVAAALDLPFMCVHTPCDNMVTSFLQKKIDAEKPYTVSEVVDLLYAIPEYEYAARHNAGPQVLVGSKERRAGKIFVDMTGGTGGSKHVFEKLANTDVSTIVGMHIGEEHRKEADKHHINVIIAGHISSDNLGINFMLDKLAEKAKPDKLKIITCSGFYRVERLS